MKIINNIKEYPVLEHNTFCSELKKQKISVLIADDSEVSRLIMKNVLNKYFSSIDTAEDGEEALSLFLQNRYDLVITDVVMPKMSGVELTRNIRTNLYLTPILAISARSKEDDLVELINAGVTAFIFKPINIELVEKQLYRIFKPIIEQRITNDRVREQENEFEVMFKTSKDAIAILDYDSRFLVFNDAYLEMSGYSTDEIKSKTCIEMSIPEDIKRTADAIEETIKRGSVQNFEKCCVGKDGTYIHISMNISLMPDGRRFLVSARDITEAKRMRLEIEEMAITDGLTKLYNRRHFNELTTKLLNAANRENKFFSFILIDVDCFKQYNDTYGHMGGDDVLITIANTMREVFKRSNEYCFRIGGEEFGVLLAVDESYDISNMAERLRSAVEELHIEHSGNSACKYVSVSMGLSTRLASGVDNFCEMFNEADELLYKAKDNGRNMIMAK